MVFLCAAQMAFGEVSQLSSDQWWSDFFQSGAFLRSADGTCWLWSNLQDDSKLNFLGLCKIHFFLDQKNFYQGTLCATTTADVLGHLENHLSRISVPAASGMSLDLLQCRDFIGPDLQDFTQAVKSIQKRISEKEITKAVASIFSRSAKQPSVYNQAIWMKKALLSAPSLHAFGVWQKGIGVLGATPEILFQQCGDQINTMALAGTQARQTQPPALSLLEDPKERHEHQLVAEDLRQQLEIWGPVQVSGPQILQLPTLLHLQTHLQVQAQDINPQDLILKLHPTPALGVAPRQRGFQWLQSLPDQQGRRVFGGPVAFQFPQVHFLPQIVPQTLCLVAIRSVQWDEQGCRLGAGCGIVAQSSLNKEWQEVQYKLRSIEMMLGLQ